MMKKGLTSNRHDTPLVQLECGCLEHSPSREQSLNEHSVEIIRNEYHGCAVPGGSGCSDSSLWRTREINVE